MVGTETGAPNIGYKSCPECRTEESLRLFIERVKPVVRWAEEESMMLAIEPVTRHIVYGGKVPAGAGGGAVRKPAGYS